MTLGMVDKSTESTVNALTDRVEKRRKAHLEATPHVSAARSRLVTESWKKTEGEPQDIREAKLFASIMEGLPVLILEDELIVGSESEYVRGTSPVVEFDPDFTFTLFDRERVTTGGLVRAAEVSNEEKASILEDARYWSGKSAGDACRAMKRQVFGQKIFDIQKANISCALEARPTGGRCLDYGKVIDKGLNGVIAEAKERLEKLTYLGKDDVDKNYLLNAMIIACEGAIKFAQRYAAEARKLAENEANPARKKELERIAEICDWVPANPARNFYEAVQSFWFTHLCNHLETSYMSETPGRMDQYLYPLYKKDIEEGGITPQEAAELLGCLWIKFSTLDSCKGLWRELAESTQLQDVTIGGVTKDGKDATNDITYLILDVAGQVKVPQPPLYLRCHKGTPEKLWRKAVETNSTRGDGCPAFVSDEAALLHLESIGIPIQDAREWTTKGCVHMDIGHAACPDRGLHINLAKVFELTLNNGVDLNTGIQLGIPTGDAKNFSYEQLNDAFKKQVDYFLDIFEKDISLAWQVRKDYQRLPFSSALMDDCMDKGLGCNQGGVRYPQLYAGVHERGHQNITDSLSAIKKLVFDEKKITMARLLEALKANFEGEENEKIRRMCLAAPKFGNDDDYVDDIYNDLSLWLQRRIVLMKHPLGTTMGNGRGGASKHYNYGKTTGALPDGRKAGEALADASLSPMRGMDLKGPTAVINSASKMNHTEDTLSTLFNLKLSSSALKGERGLQNLIALIKTYFQRGGYHIQFNLMGQETLLEGQKHPEKYRDLLVRVAGYSAYFVDLSRAIQDEIIARTEHSF